MNASPEPRVFELRKDGAVVLILLLLTLAIRFEVVFEGQIPARGDTLTGFIPHKSFVARTVQSGELPRWDPHIFAGQPFLADPQTAVFSPLSIPFYVLPLVPAFAVYMIVKHMLAGLFTYAFLRTLGANRPGALLGGIAFSFSSALFRQIPWQEVASTTVWVPLIFWLCELLIRNPRRHGVALIAAWVFAFENLAGHPQLAYYHYLAIGLYCAVRLIARLFTAGFRPVLASSAMLLLPLAVGLGLSMVQVLPLQEFKEATRYGEDFSLKEAANPMSSLEALPGVFLGGVYPDYEDHINTSYLGIVPLLCIPVGLLFGGPIALLFGLIAAIAVAIAVGTDLPLYAALYETLPGWKNLHGPVRFLPVATFALSIVAGLGAARLLDRFARMPRRDGAALPVLAGVLGLGSVAVLALQITGRFDETPFALWNAAMVGLAALALGMLFLSGRLPKALLVTAFLALAYLDLSHFDRVRYPFVYGDPTRFLTAPRTVQFMREDPELHRAIHFTNGFAVRKRVRIDDDLTRMIVASIYPNFSLHHGTYDAQGVYTLKIERYTDYVRRLNGDIKGGRWILDRLTMLGNPFSPLFDLMNVKYLLTAESNPLPMTLPLMRDGDRFVLRDPVGATDLLLEIEYPPEGDADRSDVAAEIGLRGQDEPYRVAGPPTTEPRPEFAAFRAYETGPTAVETGSVLAIAPGSDPAATGWTRHPGASFEISNGALVLDENEDARCLRSPIVPLSHRISVRYAGTPVDADNTGIYVTIVDAATDEPIYTFIYGDEGFTGLFKGKRGVKATRAVRTAKGRRDAAEVTWARDRLSFRVNDRTLFEYRDVAAPEPDTVRIEIGSRGGRFALESLDVREPVERDRYRTRRVLLPLPGAERPEWIRLIETGGTLKSVTLLDRDKFTRVHESDGVAVYRNNRVLPRAFLVGGYRVLEDEEALLDALAARDFDPTAEVLLPASPGLSAAPGPRKLEDADTEIVDYGPNGLTCRTRCSTEAILYLGDMMFEGWTARVDGEPAELLEANHCFRAIALPPGEHTVEMVYRPASIRNGMILSGVAFALWVGLAGFSFATRRRRKTTAVSPPEETPAPATDDEPTSP